jgi:hypothetical protein
MLLRCERRARPWRSSVFGRPSTPPSARPARLSAHVGAERGALQHWALDLITRLWESERFLEENVAAAEHRAERRRPRRAQPSSDLSAAASITERQAQRQRAARTAPLHRPPKRHDRATSIAPLYKQQAKISRAPGRASGVSLAKRSLRPRKITGTLQLQSTAVRLTTATNVLLLCVAHNRNSSRRHRRSTDANNRRRRDLRARALLDAGRRAALRSRSRVKQ